MNQLPKRIRVISDGRPGHENQSMGLAQAIALRAGSQIELVRLPPGCWLGRILRTRGALNRIPEAIPAKQPRGVVLIGGPSRQHGWDAKTLAAAVRDVVKTHPELAWTITDSRRTPGGFLDELRRRGIPAEISSHEQTPPGWVPEQLCAAEEAWASEDSVSMIFEAVTAGARTGVLPVPILKPSADPVRAIRELLREGRATDYETWTRNGRQLPPPRPMHETGRAAEVVLKRLFH